MLVYFARSGARHPILPVALGFLVGGSMSNLVDRVRQGYVTDFIDPMYWPAFNLGDIFITVGVAILLAIFVLGERRPRVPPQSAARALSADPDSSSPCRPRRPASGSIASSAALEAVGSRSEAERLLREGRVLVDGRRAPKSHRLAGGESVSLDLPERRASPLEPEELDLVDRLRGRRTCSSSTSRPGSSSTRPRATRRGTLVHGLLGRGIAGGGSPSGRASSTGSTATPPASSSSPRTRETHRRLQRLIRRRELVREYLALVRGRPRSWRGRIEAPIGRDRTDPTRISLDTDRPARRR